MPSISDWDKNDDDNGGADDGYTPAQSAAVGSATGTPKQATPTKQQDDGYVPWSSFVSANQDVSQREAGKLSGQVQGDVTKAQGDLSGAQSSFDGGIASNYSTPGAKGSTAASPPGSKGKGAPGTEQNQAPATSATEPWAGLAGPSGAEAQRAPRAKAATAEPTGSRTPLDGGNPWSSMSGPTSRAPVQQAGAPQSTTPQAAQGNRVTSQSPAGLAPPAAANSMGPATPAAQAPIAAGPESPDGNQSYDSNAPNFVPAGWDPNAYASANQDPHQLASPHAPNVAAGAPAMAAKPPTSPGAQNLMGFERSRQLGANAAANGAQGPADLEHAAGEKAWGQLLGDTKNAQQEANALGSESGVEGLLQQNASGPTNSAFDAALINGQGGPQFRQLAQKYGGNQLEQNVVNAEKASQDKWSQLSGDVKTRQAFDAAAKGQPAPTAAAQATTQSATQDTTATPAGSGDNSQSWAPPGYSTLDNFMDPGSNAGGGWAHAAASDASPADGATFLAGLAGYNGENTSQLFAEHFGAKGNANGGSGDFFIGNLHNALGYVGDRYGHDALQKWWSSLTPEMWKQYQDLGNGGAMARDIIQWLRSAGFTNNSSLPDGM